jgi:hypothetical protein
MKGATLQLITTGAGLGIAFLMVKIFKTQKKNKQSPNIGDGSDPNFPGGKPITPGGPVDSNDYFRPSCQVWNSNQNLFENAGVPAWNQNETECFTNAPVTSMVRYVDAKGNLSWKVEDPLADDPSQSGTCYFWDGKETYTFPDFGGYTPVNRSSRLCFSSAMDQPDVGMYFKKDSDGSLYWNPNVDFGSYGDKVSPDPKWGLWNLNGDNEWTEFGQSTGDHCQQQYSLRQIPPGNGPPDFTKPALLIWTSSVNTVSLKTPGTCATTELQRFWQPSQEKIIYFDPNDKQLVETPMLGI